MVEIGNILLKFINNLGGAVRKAAKTLPDL